MADVPLLGGQRIAAAHIEWVIDGDGNVTGAYIGSDGFAREEGLTIAPSLTGNGYASAIMTLSREINNADCAIVATSVPRVVDGPDFEHVQVQARAGGIAGESTPRIELTAFFPPNFAQTDLTQRVYVAVFRLNRG